MLMDPELKLFGMKISLPENHAAFAGGDRCGESFNETSDGTSDCYRCLDESSGEEAGEQENLLRIYEEQAEGKVFETSTGNEDEDPEESTNTDVDDSPKSPSTDDDVRLGDQAKNQNGDQKNLKKPDKILPCPRCKSMDTKFCYYNNYNMNQPRHFCKSCQRYWTSGGTMRNVPVGAGRRKNKNSASHCHHITISQALHAARLDTPNSGFHNLKFKPNSTVLSFGPDEKTQPPNGCYKIDQDCLVNESSDGGRNGFRQPTVQNMSWPFPAPLPAIFPHGYPLPPPYYVAPFWNLPWLHMPSSSPTASSPSSPLGKRSRSGELLKSSESSIVVPKTLRMDVPEEAAKSSIWSTLGIKYNSISREGLLKALQPKIDDKKPMATTSPLLQANPAALSRSLTFQETA